MLIAQTTDATVWIAVGGIIVSIVGGAFFMGGRLGSLSSSVDNVNQQLKANTTRLDVLDAKVDAAKETAAAATATAANTAALVATTLRNGRTPP